MISSQARGSRNSLETVDEPDFSEQTPLALYEQTAPNEIKASRMDSSRTGDRLVPFLVFSKVPLPSV